MKKMKKLFNFLYAILVVFATIGGSGYLFYYKVPQFAIPVLIIGVLLALSYFEKIKLPTRKGLFE